MKKPHWRSHQPVGHPAAKREAFVALVTLLYKLGVTKYIATPTMSNPYNLVDKAEIDKIYEEYRRTRVKAP